MSSDYLTLTNRVLKAFNEVPLNASTFPSATGFYADVQDAINQAILDIYTWQDTRWPFAWENTTFVTTVGQRAYSKDTTFTAVDWETFKILRGSATGFTLTQTAGTATFTSPTPHYFLTGDVITIAGATPTGYNLTATVTVTGSTTFTYPVDSTLSSPATGTITAISESVFQKALDYKPYDFYIDQRYDDTDANTDNTGYGTPNFVVRKPDNNFLIAGPCDRVYKVYYEGFSLPSNLVLYSDVADIPAPFDQVIINKALHYAYMFRDNVEEAALVQDRYEKTINNMRRILIPQQTFAIASD